MNPSASPEVDALQAALRGRYLLEGELGRGGMGIVFLGRDIALERPVAIKLLPPHFAGIPEIRARFLQEARTAARLAHPHIIPIHSVETHGDLACFVMSYVPGRTVAEVVQQEGPMPPAAVARMIQEVAWALAYAHRQGVVHRDVKPENILLEAGHAVVADFGIARALDVARGERLTETGMSVGTPAYMSPEQASGEANVDGRADLYALGCVLYEMLAGQPPFTGATVESVVYQHLVAEARAVSQVRPGIPPAVSRALGRLLAKAPADRPATAAELLEALEGTGPLGQVVAAAPERSIAVLPFANMSADAENEYLADGIAEEIINALTKLPGLKVVARTSAFSFKGKQEDLRTVGEKLGVATVLEGSVRRAGDRLRVTAQLVNVSDGYHQWSERYDRELRDVFAIQDQIAAAIAERLQVTFAAPAGGLVQAGTQSVEAYQLYVKGRALLYRRGLNIARARQCFEEALALDPGYALAHAGLADSLNYLAMWGAARSQDIVQQTRTAIGRALELAPDLAEAHYALACIAQYRDYDADVFRREYARAVELSPGYIQARCGRALYDLSNHRLDFVSALTEADRAVRDDPLSAYAVTVRAVILAHAGRFAEAVPEARRATELDPASVVAWWQYQCISGWAGDHEEAAHAGETALALSDRFTWPVATLAAERGRAGDRPAAERLCDELRDRAASGYVQPTMLAIAAVGCGRLEEGLALLRQAAEEHDFVLPSFIKCWGDLAPLRAHPGFGTVLRRMGWE
jgi:TolB-like protein/Tfp pilus assembly protein PilF